MLKTATIFLRKPSKVIIPRGDATVNRANPGCQGALNAGSGERTIRASMVTDQNSSTADNFWVDNAEQKKHFQQKLLAWYELNRRDLPWRADRDPYRVWISEIMLQQTRVSAVIEHYRKFLLRFPTVKKLARAKESSVLVAWSGLGYYRRARMLHAASKKVLKLHGGKLPGTREELGRFPGIGRYTSAAIASIAFGEPVAAVDGNVHRVVERLLGRTSGAQEVWKKAERLLCRDNPGDFNQAMMELGATVCLPGQPNCPNCPVTRECSTRGSLSKIGSRKPQKKRVISYALNCRNGSVFLVKRSAQAALMPGMWELPEIDINQDAGVPAFTLRHSITVTDYTVRVVTKSSKAARSSGEWVKNNRAGTLPLTGLARKILREGKVI
jgi:A/G-specific adenine glycosylase